MTRMNSDPEKIETLRKLMALKRHEQPPPDYLHRLSDRIITRIEHGEGERTFWDKLSANFSLRPSLAYAFGLTVCGALGLSSVYMVRQEMVRSADDSSAVAVREPVALRGYGVQVKPAPAPLHVANWLVNTNPVADPQMELSLFNDQNQPAIPVSYETGK